MSHHKQNHTAASSTERASAPPPRRLSREALGDELAELDGAALAYDAERDGGLEVVASYANRDGTTHQVCVNYHPVAASWRIIDVAPDATATLVERLSGGGADETRGAAVAYAVDYAREARAYADGTRDSPPLPPAPRDEDGNLLPHPAAMTMIYRES